MDSRPYLNEVLEILEMKDTAVALYEEIDRRVAQIVEEFGADRFDYDLGSADEDGKQFLKFEVTDNVRKLRDGENVWKSISFKPNSFNVAMLKNRPKSLK